MCLEMGIIFVIYYQININILLSRSLTMEALQIYLCTTKTARN